MKVIVAGALSVALAGCAPALPEGLPATASARYRCGDGTGFTVRFDNRADTAAIVLDGRRLLLQGQRPASGIWYAGDGVELRGKGDAATLSRSGSAPTECSAA